MAELPGKVGSPNFIVSHALVFLLRVVDVNTLINSKELISKMRKMNIKEQFPIGIHFTITSTHKGPGLEHSFCICDSMRITDTRLG